MKYTNLIVFIPLFISKRNQPNVHWIDIEIPITIN